MRKSKKQMVMAAAACAMMGVMVIGGTMAYLTDSETATNTFTIGQVKIDLEEPEYAKLTDTQKKNLVPNQIVAKDPQVENTGVNDAIVFLKVEMPKKDVIVAEKDGTRKTTAVTELFTMLNTDIDPAADGSTDGKNWESFRVMIPVLIQIYMFMLTRRNWQRMPRPRHCLTVSSCRTSSRDRSIPIPRISRLPLMRSRQPRCWRARIPT